MTVALLFYIAAFVVLRAWGDAALGRQSPRRLRVTANVAVVAIAAVFLNSYLARVERMPVYWLPALGLAGIVALSSQDPWIGSPSLRSSTLQRRCQRVQREHAAVFR